MYSCVRTTVAGVGVVAASPVVLVEEPKLESTFGDGYRDYCDRVPRWLPPRPEGWARHTCCDHVCIALMPTLRRCRYAIVTGVVICDKHPHT
jgi:hypothetical protein